MPATNLYPMPPQATDWAVEVDWINAWITDVSIFFTVAIVAVMVYFAWKYRASVHPEPTSDVSHSPTLETVWTVVPSIIVIYVFWIGFDSYREMRTPPANPVEISVTGYKWGWNFEYASGKKASRTLTVPLGRPVRLIMKSIESTDTETAVIHSFFIPSMRVKEDVVPNRYSYLWFTPNKLGDFHIFCAEYCGLQHSAMRGVLRVVTPEAFDDFLLDREKPQENLSPSELGKKLYIERGCNACHSIDGSRVVGPTFKALGGKNRKFEDGTEAVADENYLRESILHPKAKIVSGYPPVMPSYQGQLDDSEVAGLIAYIKSLN